MDIEKQEIDLRDQFAIAAMQGIMNRYSEFVMSYMTNTDPMVDSNKLEKFLQNIAKASYKMADCMREARIAAFK